MWTIIILIGLCFIFKIPIQNADISQDAWLIFVGLIILSIANEMKSDN